MSHLATNRVRSETVSNYKENIDKAVIVCHMSSLTKQASTLTH